MTGQARPTYLQLEQEYWATAYAPPDDLIFDDGEPLESNRHRIGMNVLIDSTLIALEGRSDFFAGGNMFVYYSNDQAMNREFRGPDFFVATNVDGDRERQGWVVWQEGGRFPNVIVELLSPRTAHIDLGVKKDLYEQTFRTGDYFVYDPFDPNSLQGWHLNNSRGYEALAPDDRGWLWCETLGLWLGTWEGAIRREPPTGTCSWLRFYNREGELIPIQEEQAQYQTERAEEEHQRAEEERRRAEEEHQRAEEERRRAERLAARLRELGEDPNRL